MNIRQVLAKNLLFLMEKEDTNKSKVSQRARDLGFNLHKNTLSDIENGAIDVKISTIQNIAYVFNVKVGDLLSESLCQKQRSCFNVNESLDLFNWVVLMVETIFIQMKLSDVNFKCNLILKLTELAANEGKEAAYFELIKNINDYYN